MKKTKILVLASMLLFLTVGAYAQMAPLKNYDFSKLDNKVLYIPTYESSEKFIKRMSKKGKFDRIQNAKERNEQFNTMWREAMAESSYDATEYEIRDFEYRDMIKSKNPKALLLYYYFDDYGNNFAQLVVTGPKRKTIASVLITGLDLEEKNDLRLMINMLDDALNTARDAQEEGGTRNKHLRNKYKEKFLEFYSEIGDKTFLVPKSEHKKAKKAIQRTADLKGALSTWKLSNSELTTYAAIEEKRIEGDPDSFYWRDIPYYTNNPLITYHINYILSCDGDAVLFQFLGKKRLKPSTLEQIQSKIEKKAVKYKEDLAD